MLSTLALASAPYARIIGEDLMDIKLAISFGVMTFNPANCSWEELNIDSVVDLSGNACDSQQRSYISTHDWMDGNAFFAYCNNNNEIKIK